MFTKIVKNDLKESKLVSMTIFAFILFASFLLSTVGMLVVNLSSSVNHFLETARTPHFLQMHMGGFDSERMFNFAKSNEHVLDYQAMPFLNVDSNDILINDVRFSENSQDNGFSYQSKNFDFLLDLEGRIIHPKEGEIYIPLVYYTNGTLKTGDKISISWQDFLIKGPIRDAQMSSMLSSSKRFLINENDYEKIKSVGREEILIEFLLKDLSNIEKFQGDYSKANLESNGPTITHSIIKLINALTDGIMIAIMFLIAFLTVIVSFLCIRLTLMSKIEDEYKTIGVLKAIGIRLSEIKKIYLAKYAFIALFGCVFGLIFTFVFSGFFLKNIRLFFGESEAGVPAAISAFIGSIFIFLIIMLYINLFLNRLKKLSPATAINEGIVSDKSSSLKRFKLRKQKLLSTDMFLGINRILTRKRTYLTFVLIIIIASFVMILPGNIYSSIASDKFTTYMGIGDGDAMMVFSDKDDVKDLDLRLENDKDVENYVIYDNKSYEYMIDENTTGKMWVTLGSHEKFPVLYTKGDIPKNENEIAVSYLNAAELDKKVGDTLTLIINGQKKDLVITGIYSDITNGGKTARASFIDDLSPSLTGSVVMNFKEDVEPDEKLKSFEKAYPDAKVYNIRSYRDAVFGSTLNNIRTSGIVAVILSVGLAFLITLLFVNMLVAKDRQNISILKSLGFTNKNLYNQYMAGSLLLGAASMIFGMLLVSTLGEAITGAFVETMGVANFRFEIDKRFIFFITPASMLLTVFIGTNLALQSIREIKVSDYIRG